MNLQALLTHKFDAKTVSYNDRDTMLYALSLGAGDPAHLEQDLNLVYEKNLVCLPTITAVLAHPGLWMTAAQFDIKLVKLLHAEQRIDFYHSIPPSGEIRAEYRVSAIIDKGPDKGAFMHFDKDIYNTANNELLCTVRACYLLRGDGGCGSFGEAPAALAAVPSGEPDIVSEIAIDERAALIYRLNGDRNPLHVDPAIAKQAGFAKPILHGLCAYGVAGLALTRAIDGDVNRIASLGLRFSAPVYPGETLVIEGWRSAAGIHFRASSKERQQIVLNNGFMALR
ncbi:MAG: MaoC/PaaZ C-terminal domain-containing protein [Zhongshania sp.]|uniref:MaoC/PaaZ C-terminal domain-containing protein n=1 Tax=Zhongshania sp. TaxID=1971902 RepID=UPI0026348789|nr:MaoC/PaaZ C-terminal domain-containing protein [Zhongshania sp.]MDF1690755.1 MaoC/PaaZ C-terminal domain-containing protein [Zhongshania sp.]